MSAAFIVRENAAKRISLAFHDLILTLIMRKRRNVSFPSITELADGGILEPVLLPNPSTSGASDKSEEGKGLQKTHREKMQ